MPVTIQLAKPVPTHGADVTSITFRDPVFDDWIAVGRDPDTIVQGPNDTLWRQVDVDALRQYAERLAVGNEAKHALGLVAIEDAIKIRDAIIGFFRPAERRSSASETPSSSITASPPTPSAG